MTKVDALGRCLLCGRRVESTAGCSCRPWWIATSGTVVVAPVDRHELSRESSGTARDSKN